MKFAGRYLDQENKKFDWVSFKKAVDNIHSDNLTFDDYKNVTINQSESTVDLMVSKIVQFLSEAFGAIIDPKEFATTVLTTFTNLKVKSDAGFANFSKSSDGSNTSFTYRIVFAIANKMVPTDFYSLVTTIKLTADIHEKSGWFGLTHSSSKNFSAEIDAMELVVAKDFQAPPMK